MSIEFVKNSCPILTQEMYDFLNKNQSAYEMDFSKIKVGESLDFEQFFDLLDNDNKIGFVFFELGGESSCISDIEIAVGKLSSEKYELLQYVIDNLNEFKKQFPEQWLQYAIKDWSAVIQVDKETQKNGLCNIFLKNQFVEVYSDDAVRIFKRAIAS